MKQTIEHLQNDVILGNKSINKPTSTPQHNLFQTFRVSVRMFSLTVLHYDPIYSRQSSRSRSSSRPGTSGSGSGSNSNTRRFIVERIKPTCDVYFDFVSTIDTSSVCGTTASAGLSQSIDKSIISKYHQVGFVYNIFSQVEKKTFKNLNIKQFSESYKIHSTFIVPS